MIKIKDVVFLLSYFIGFIGFLSVSPYIGIPFLSMFLLMFFVGILIDRGKLKAPPRYVLNILSLLFVFSMFFRINMEDIVIPVVETTTLLLGIKLIEEKRFRDFMQIYTLSVFLLAGSALLSLDMKFILYFMLMFFSIVVAMVFLTYLHQETQAAVEKKLFYRMVKKLLIIPVISIPFTVLLFVVMPRTEYPVFSFLGTAKKGKTGFSDTVELGTVSQIQEDSSIVMRIKTDRPLDRENTYIRGTVLNFFDGKRWVRRPVKEESVINRINNPVRQEIIIEPTGDRYIFGIDTPVKVLLKDVRRSGDYVFNLNRRIFSRVKYTVISDLSGRIKASHIDTNFYTQLPSSISQQVRELALSLKGKNPEETVQNVVNYVRSNFRYTLKDIKTGSDPVYEFLFVKKKGNCEFFASSAAVLLRLNNIPVRMVAGYRGVDYNDIGNYYVVSQKYAHTWIEVYLNGYWERFDPTGSSVSVLNKDESSLYSKIKNLVDAIEYAYINSVINFGLKDQISYARKIGNIFGKLNFSFDRVYLLTFITILIFFAFVYFAWVHFNRSYEEKLIKQFLKKMEKYGYKKRENQGLEEFLSQINDGLLREKAERFVSEFERFYYKDRKVDSETYRKLRSIINNI